MNISSFFADRLQAPLKNPMWSWGANDASSERVFLRTEDINIVEDNGEWALIHSPDWRKSHGHKERLEHIELMKKGACGYAIIYRTNDAGKTEWFDDQFALRLGEIVYEKRKIYSKIKGKVCIETLIQTAISSSVLEDISVIARTSDETECLAMVSARLGQGKFRDDVLKLWNNQCCVTGIRTKTTIIASHIKPWKACNNQERLDPDNGLPLVATLDRLFDKGLISFEFNGKIRVSPLLADDDVSKLRLDGLKLQSDISNSTKRYLTYHQNVRFKRNQ